MKRILVIIDGMDDERIEALGSLTPREAAFMPGLARMRRHGRVGQVSTIPSGNEPGTDVALLN
ncbi:MAG: phosphoglycerate mutase, partial [Muribaculaceae bacterium]|nr:phosphoglycerate mutase [Muribaculaceae bacterium]